MSQPMRLTRPSSSEVSKTCVANPWARQPSNPLSNFVRMRAVADTTGPARGPDVKLYRTRSGGRVPATCRCVSSPSPRGPRTRHRPRPACRPSSSQVYKMCEANPWSRPSSNLLSKFVRMRAVADTTGPARSPDVKPYRTRPEAASRRPVRCVSRPCPHGPRARHRRAATTACQAIVQPSVQNVRGQPMVRATVQPIVQLCANASCRRNHRRSVQPGCQVLSDTTGRQRAASGASGEPLDRQHPRLSCTRRCRARPRARMHADLRGSSRASARLEHATTAPSTVRPADAGIENRGRPGVSRASTEAAWTQGSGTRMTALRVESKRRTHQRYRMNCINSPERARSCRLDGAIRLSTTS